MAKKELICANCGKLFQIEFGEWNYWHKRGRDHFFCSRSCSAQKSNANFKKWDTRTQVCEFCGKEFSTSSPYTVKFCSRSCASAGSMDDYRRQRMREAGLKSSANSDTHCIAKLLKVREAYRYADLTCYLESQNIEFEFEFCLGNYVFDLCLPTYKTLVEFDEDYHKHNQANDIPKSDYAKNLGWKVIHIDVMCHEVIQPDKLNSIIC